MAYPYKENNSAIERNYWHMLQHEWTLKILCISFIWNICNKQTHSNIKSILVVGMDWGEKEMRSDCLISVGFPLGVMKMFYCGSFTTQWMYHMLLMVNFIISFLKIQILTGPRRVMEVNESMQVLHSGKVECEGPSKGKATAWLQWADRIWAPCCQLPNVWRKVTASQIVKHKQVTWWCT